MESSLGSAIAQMPIQQAAPPSFDIQALYAFQGHAHACSKFLGSLGCGANKVLAPGSQHKETRFRQY